MSARSEIRPALERVIERMRARRYPVDVALLRVLRDYGLECREIGVRSVHNARTIPAGGPLGDDEITGRYSIEHPLLGDDGGNDGH